MNCQDDAHVWIGLQSGQRVSLCVCRDKAALFLCKGVRVVDWDGKPLPGDQALMQR